ncbi:MAG: manganese transport protein, partial [Rubritepida sp.]|nr:manganese transport protein [Rubritepida sp.]
MAESTAHSLPARSLPEVHRSVAVPNAGGFLRKLFAFMGPGYLIAVGYM